MSNLIIILSFLFVCLLSYVLVRTFKWSLCIVFILFFFLFNYVGIFFVALGHSPVTFSSLSYSFPAATELQSYWIAFIGYISFVTGMLLVLQPRPTVRGKEKIVQAKIDAKLVLFLSLTYSAVIIFNPQHNLLEIYRVVTSLRVLDLYFERLSTQYSAFTTLFNYVLIPVYSLYAMFVSVLLCAAKLIYLQKQPLMIFFIQSAMMYLMIANAKFQNYIWLGLSSFIILVILYISTTPDVDISLEGLQLISFLAFERIFLRAAYGYFSVAEFMPESMGYVGFASLKPLADLFSLHYVDIGSELFTKVVAGNKSGNISLPLFAWFYGCFGWVGVTVGGVFSGISLRIGDIVMSGWNNYTKSAAIASLAVIPIYLTETNIFSALFGFGGLVILSHIALFTRLIRTQKNTNSMELKRAPN